MTTTPDTSSHGPSRVRIVVARVLVVLGVLLLVVSLLSNWVKREALDKDQFRSTSEELIAHPDIQDQLAQTMVEQLYANVDVSQQLEEKLPPNLQALAGPIAGLSRELVDRAATELLQRPRVQTLFVNAASLSQAQVVKVLEGETTRLQTTGGDVVLDLHPLVTRLGDRFGVLGNATQQLPPDAGRIVLLRSDELSTAQNVTQLLKSVANWIWVPMLLLWAVAIWLVRGRRRKEVRAIAVGIILGGILVLVVRRVAGTYLVDHLTSSDSVRPAVSAFWSILSDGLAEAAWSVIAIGVVAAIGVWLTGEGARAGSARRWLAPWMARTDLAWLVFAVLVVLVLWVLPLHRFVLYLVLAALAVVGFEVLRRQIVNEYEAEGSPERRPLSAPWGKEKPPPADAGVDELERLAKLRSEELLTEDEYAAAKGRILPPAGG
ncbi:MAG TPA: SHOCT domain-containing protein [Gaiella sp.]|nr:SHOCT domain-containing protein [Gaiella sp.]